MKYVHRRTYVLNAELLKLIVVASFGRNAQAGYKTGLYKLAAGATGSLLFGMVMGVTISRARLPADLPVWWLALLIGALSCALKMLIAQVLAALSTQHGRTGGALKVTVVLPLSHFEKWLVRSAALLSIGACLLLFLAPLTIGFSRATHTNAAYLLLAVLCGIVSGFGFGSLPVRSWQRPLVLVAMLLLQGKLLEMILYSNSRIGMVGLAIISGLLTSSGWVVAFWQYTNKTRMIPQIAKSHRLQWHPAVLRRGWFMIKLVRNKRTSASILIAFTIVVTMFLAVTLKGLGRLGGVGWLMFSATLSAAIASDVRGISRRYKTSELVVFGTVERFIIRQLVAAGVISTVIALPMLALATMAHVASMLLVVIFFLAMQIAASAIGLAMSTLFVPENGDVGGQFFAASLASAGVLLSPKLLHFSAHDSLLHMASGWLIVGFIGVLIMFVTEKLRRNNYANA